MGNFSEEKMFYSQDVSRFLCFCVIHRFQTVWHHQRDSYIMDVTLTLVCFEILSTIIMKFGQTINQSISIFQGKTQTLQFINIYKHILFFT